MDSGIATPGRASVNARMRVAELAFNRILGIVDAPAGAAHLLEMPATPLLRNHLGTVHAAAQFALAEAASAECLQRHYGHLLPPEAGIAVVRGVTVKYRRPVDGDLLAFGRPDAATLAHLEHDLATRTRLTAAVEVELRDRDGRTSFTGRFDWFIGRPESLPS